MDQGYPEDIYLPHTDRSSQWCGPSRTRTLTSMPSRPSSISATAVFLPLPRELDMPSHPSLFSDPRLRPHSNSICEQDIKTVIGLRELSFFRSHSSAIRRMISTSRSSTVNPNRRKMCEDVVLPLLVRHYAYSFVLS